MRDFNMAERQQIERTMTGVKPCSYFIAKVASVHDLQRCSETSIWACRDRLNPPHPRTVLSTALEKSTVILIFSVNNCHGWHGYAEMLGHPIASEGTDVADSHETPGCIAESTLDKAVSDSTYACKSSNEKIVSINKQEMHEIKAEDADKDVNRLDSVWFRFPIRWKVCYIKEFGEQCLSSKLTEHFKVSDTLYLNKARNWQEVSVDRGQEVCALIDEFYHSLCEKRLLQQQKILEKQPDPFFRDEQQVATVEETWNSIVEKIENELGQVILACPFGSQRYNLNVPSSDTDMFIVYQARTKDLLGFHPPKQTIKNSERESCDYTIHEVYRYAELLLSGDARCVETLFLHDSTVVKASSQWQALKQGGHYFLNQDTLSKYLRDAQGTKGTKQLRKWCEDNPTVKVLPPKMYKLLYVIVRLLQNARDIVKGRQLCVYRETQSTERSTLMSIRNGDVTVKDAREIIARLESEIQEKKAQVPERQGDTEHFLENWLLELRKADFLNQS